MRTPATMRSDPNRKVSAIPLPTDGVCNVLRNHIVKQFFHPLCQGFEVGIAHGAKIFPS